MPAMWAARHLLAPAPEQTEPSCGSRTGGARQSTPVLRGPNTFSTATWRPGCPVESREAPVSGCPGHPAPAGAEAPAFCEHSAEGAGPFSPQHSKQTPRARRQGAKAERPAQSPPAPRRPTRPAQASGGQAGPSLLSGGTSTLPGEMTNQVAPHQLPEFIMTLVAPQGMVFRKS